MPCDDTDECPYPGQPGYEGALELPDQEVAELFKCYKALGSWALEPQLRHLMPEQAGEVIHVLYELEVENTRLKGVYPEVRMLWDPDPPMPTSNKAD